jgi:hypothetical protein
MTLVVRAFPLAPGKEEAVRAFADELRTRRAGEAAGFYRRFGVSRESWHLQRTPHGSWVIGVTEVSDRPLEDAAEAYSQSEDPFDRWFKDQVHHLTGINPDEQPLGPPTACLFDTDALPGGDARRSGGHTTTW